MTKRMNWRKASLSPKRSMSVIGENEHRQNDRAARWLAKVEGVSKDGKNVKTGKTVKVKQ